MTFNQLINPQDGGTVAVVDDAPYHVEALRSGPRTDITVSTKNNVSSPPSLNVESCV